MITPLFKDRSMIFDSHLEPSNNGWTTEFVESANADCYSFLPNDWYVEYYDAKDRMIFVRSEVYKNAEWMFHIIADPTDEDDEQWLVYDVALIE
jgi:hypothetical protein